MHRQQVATPGGAPRRVGGGVDARRVRAAAARRRARRPGGIEAAKGRQKMGSERLGGPHAEVRKAARLNTHSNLCRHLGRFLESPNTNLPRPPGARTQGRRPPGRQSEASVPLGPTHTWQWWTRPGAAACCQCREPRPRRTCALAAEESGASGRQRRPLTITSPRRWACGPRQQATWL